GQQHRSVRAAVLPAVLAAVLAVHAHVELPSDLLPADQEALDRFKDLAIGVDAVVAKHRPSDDHALTTADTDDFVDRLSRLRGQDPATADVVTARLRKVLDGAADQ